MARNRKDAEGEFVLVNVLYEDGSQRSNRRIPRSCLEGFDDEGDIRRALEAQDRDIAAVSGRPRGPIKVITRVRQ